MTISSAYDPAMAGAAIAPPTPQSQNALQAQRMQMLARALMARQQQPQMGAPQQQQMPPVMPGGM